MYVCINLSIYLSIFLLSNQFRFFLPDLFVYYFLNFPSYFHFISFLMIRLYPAIILLLNTCSQQKSVLVILLQLSSVLFLQLSIIEFELNCTLRTMISLVCYKFLSLDTRTHIRIMYVRRPYQ